MSTYTSLRYLVVDDSPTMRRIVLNAINSFGINAIAEADNGKTAAEKIITQGCDFVITDWNMPIMSGLDLTKWIRNQDQFKHLPVLMVTTRDNKQDVVEALKAQVNNYIVKPFTPNGLREKIEQIIAAVMPEALTAEAPATVLEA